MINKTLSIPLALLLAAIVAILGYLGYAASQKRTQQRQVVEVVRDTTDKLRKALRAHPEPEIVTALEANLQAAKAPRDPALADAAEHYIIGAREIVRRRVEIERLERDVAASRQALAGHMAHASSRNSAWLRDAVALKKRVEDEYFSLGLKFKALDDILFSMPEAEKRLEGHVGRELLVPLAETETARKQVQAEAQRAAAQLERVRQLR